MKINTDTKKIDELLGRGVEEIYPAKNALKTILKSGKKLRIYFGIDPTAPTLHLDHGTSLLILKRFQQLGHKIILLIGDFTAKIGDPTGKNSVRKQLSKREILRNYRNYKKQASKIIDFESKENPAEIIFNSDWWEKISFEDLMKLMSKFTVQKFLARDMFQKRIKRKKEIYLNEFMYPLLQGYDSVMLNVDVELGGSDQIFNMLVGRNLMKIYKNKEKFVIAKKILEDPKTGKMLMSKSEGRYIGLGEEANQMYGKIMALPDEVIFFCFEHWTEISLKKINKIKKDLKIKKLNPKDAKEMLAFEVVKIYHSKEEAKDAKEEFNRIFKEKKVPSKIPIFIAPKNEYQILYFLVWVNLAKSKSEARRLIEQKGIKIIKKTKNKKRETKIIESWQGEIKMENNMIVQAGKRKFIKIIRS